jgi:hypothetical protein
MQQTSHKEVVIVEKEEEIDDNDDDDIPDYSTWSPIVGAAISTSKSTPNTSETLFGASSHLQIEEEKEVEQEEEIDVPNYEDWSYQRATDSNISITDNRQQTFSPSAANTAVANNMINDDFNFLIGDRSMEHKVSVFKSDMVDLNRSQQKILFISSSEQKQKEKITTSDNNNNNNIFRLSNILDLSNEEESEEDDSEIDSLSYEEWKKRHAQQASATKADVDKVAERTQNLIDLFDRMKLLQKEEVSVDMLPDEHEEFLKWMFPLTNLKK